MQHTPGFSALSLIPFLTVFLLCSESGQCLQCYSCIHASRVSGLCDGTVTCAAGEVCSNRVYKRYSLSTVYTKGCMARSMCQALQYLNSADMCALTPSECTYCCYHNTCNQGTRRTTSHPTVLGVFYLIATAAFLLAST